MASKWHAPIPWSRDVIYYAQIPGTNAQWIYDLDEQYNFLRVEDKEAIYALDVRQGAVDIHMAMVMHYGVGAYYDEHYDYDYYTNAQGRMEQISLAEVAFGVCRNISAFTTRLPRNQIDTFTQKLTEIREFAEPNSAVTWIFALNHFHPDSMFSSVIEFIKDIYQFGFTFDDIAKHIEDNSTLTDLFVAVNGVDSDLKQSVFFQ